MITDMKVITLFRHGSDEDKRADIREDYAINKDELIRLLKQGWKVQGITSEGWHDHYHLFKHREFRT